MTNAEIDKAIEQLDKEHWALLESYLNSDAIVCGQTSPSIPKGELIKQLTDDYYAKKQALEKLRTGGATS